MTEQQMSEFLDLMERHGFFPEPHPKDGKPYIRSPGLFRRLRDQHPVGHKKFMELRQDPGFAALVRARDERRRQPVARGPQERAVAYLLKCDPAVSGQGGHNQTFKVCCCLLRTIPELTEGELLAALREWNQTCRPPWSERELRHKVADAVKAVRRSAPPPPADDGDRDATLADLVPVFRSPGGPWVVWLLANMNANAVRETRDSYHQRHRLPPGWPWRPGPRWPTRAEAEAHAGRLAQLDKDSRRPGVPVYWSAIVLHDENGPPAWPEGLKPQEGPEGGEREGELLEV